MNEVMVRTFTRRAISSRRGTYPRSALPSRCGCIEATSGLNTGHRTTLMLGRRRRNDPDDRLHRDPEAEQLAVVPRQGIELESDRQPLAQSDGKAQGRRA